MLRIYQDGNMFYDDSTGNVVFTSSIVVKDYDLKAAELARTEFIEWADRIDLDYRFIGE